MSRILMVYGTAYGQTARIVSRIAELLRRADHEVTMHQGDQVPPSLDPSTFDGCLVAASVLYGRHQRYVTDFVRRHVTALNARPSAFVSVSGSAASPDPVVRAQVQSLVEQFLQQTGWRPTRVRAFGGAMAYTRYNWLMRRLTQWHSRRAGGPTDMTRDHELTDWREVERFAGELAELLAGAPRQEQAAPAAV